MRLDDRYYLSVLYAEVIVDARGEVGSRTWLYEVPPALLKRAQIGMGAVVPLGNQTVVGVIMRLRESLTDASSSDPIPTTIKPIETLLDQPLLSPALMKLVGLLQRETFCSEADAVHTVMPSVVRTRLRTIAELTGEIQGLRSSTHLMVAEAIRDAGGSMSLPALKQKFASAILKNALSALRKKGLLRGYVELVPPPSQFAQTSLIQLNASPAQLEQFFREQGKRKRSQSALLTRLALHPEGAMPVQTLLQETGASDATLRQLESSGLARRVSHPSVPHDLMQEPAPAHELTLPQQNAIKAIQAALKTGSFQRQLLFGVTGSGKTEVYLRATSECLQQGRGVLILVPEIALTMQLTGAFRARFGDSVAVLHSQLSESERFDQWLRARAGEKSVVIGARSAIFAPLESVGLIIVDEEHETAYKQQNLPRYDARQLAEARARESNALLLLGSATPSLESYYQVEQGNAALLELPERASGVLMPLVQIVDLRQEKSGILSQPLRFAMERAITQGKQTLLLLNRRAFSPSLLCRECGYVAPCPHCSVALAYHLSPPTLRCHHCDHREPAPTRCPKCDGKRFAPHGIGTQRVEQAIQTAMPHVSVARLDRDALTSKERYVELLRAFRSGEIQILVGTQMIAKGLDFPNVQLVGVVNADTALYLPDFRAGERTFQLLTQVAGRAGRRELQGEVIIQTYNPDHPALLFAREHDFKGFYRWEMANRRELNYPPFCRMANLIAQSDYPDKPKALLETLKQKILVSEDWQSWGKSPQARLLGPAPAPLSRLAGQYRFHMMLRMPFEMDAAAFLGRVIDGMPPDERALLQIDLDPVNLL